MIAQDDGFSTTVTMDDVAAAYRLFLRRPPEASGIEHFKGLVSQGMTIERLASAFMWSDEFNNLRRSRLITVDLGGYSVVIDPNETEVAPGIMENKDYEPHVRRVIAERFHAGQTFVDLGANVGCISFLAAKIAGPTGRVISIEPNPTNLQRLYAGIVLNGFTNVHVLPFAASDRRTTFSLTGGESNTYLTSAKGIDINTVYTQSIIPDEALANLPTLDFIKMDVEGHETQVLRGFSTLIRKHNPTLICEFCPFAHTVVGHDPMQFLYTLVGLFNHLTVLSGFGDSIEFTDARDLMEYWQRRDAELSSAGHTAEGMLLFDILATNR